MDLMVAGRGRGRVSLRLRCMSVCFGRPCHRRNRPWVWADGGRPRGA